MSEVWITHPDPDIADSKVGRSAVGGWIGCGWAVREDQSDPEPEPVELPDLPDPDGVERDYVDHGDGPDAAHETPAHEAPANDDNPKGA